MFLTKKQIKQRFNPMIYEKGEAFYLRGQVQVLKISRMEDRIDAWCRVEDSEPAETHLYVVDKKLYSQCDCWTYARADYCKHIVASLLACADFDSPEDTAFSDPAARTLLNSYMKKIPAERSQTGTAHLVPRLAVISPREYPYFNFQVGYDRLYVVKDIQEFLKNVCQKRTTTYGKNLTLYQGIENFDEHSRALIDLLMDQYDDFRTVGSYSHTYYPGYYGYGYQKNQIQLTGTAFDRWFDLLRDRPLVCVNRAKPIALSEEDPAVSLTLTRLTKHAELTVRTEDDWTFFGSVQSLYAVSRTRLLRCSGAFRQQVYPLLQIREKSMQLALRDMPAFCSCVLPEIQELVEITDDDGLLQEYLPDDCIPCFYLDLNEDVLSLSLSFRYGEEKINLFSKSSGSVKRNIRAEQAAQKLTEQYFQAEGEQFLLRGEDAVIRFLMDDLPVFQNAGEVFLSSALQARQFQPARSSVGVSVSDGILWLDMDTGGFPPEELEALYQSLLKRRRYYRLKDGRFMNLTGSGCEKLSEMAHMLQLSPKELAKGERLKMPAFRGLYLDDLLSGCEDIQYRRDQQFRAMIRNFKSVTESDYAPPEELESVLRPYQKTGFQWLKTLESSGFGGILADEMGLGKTIQMIAYLCTVRNADTGMPSLVVCPASLILNWMDELARFAPDLDAAAIMGPASERKKQIAAGGSRDVWITSYELLRQDIEIYADLKFYCCVLDEGQHIKNQSTLASRAVKRIDCRQRFVLTGTPIENRLSELWNLFDFLMPGYLFTHRTFVERLEKPVVKSGDAAAAAQLRRLVQPFMLRRLKKDVLKELPPKIEHVRRIPLSQEERKVYLASAAAARNELSGGEQGKLMILAALTQLRQICCAPELCFENYSGPDSKLEACIELCTGMAANGHQILLFSQFTSMLDLIRPRLDEAGLSHFTLQGSTTKEKRAQLVRDFNAGKADVFLISLKAGGTGLNLTAADVVIHYDPWWNIAAQDQATDRAHRIGQQSSVQVYKLIAEDTIEERILELQSKKAALMDTVSDDSGTTILDMSKEDLLALLA